MKLLAIAIFVALLSGACITHAEEISDKQKAKQVMGKIINQCATITGANYLNQKCKQLTDQPGDQLSEEPAYCQEKISKIMGPNPKFIAQLDRSAHEVADKTECNEKSKTIIIQSFNMSVPLHDALSKLVNGPNTTDLRNPH